jgi:hypothetical protein
MANAWDLSVSTHINDSQGTLSFVDYQPDGSGDCHLTDGSCTDQGIASLGAAAAPTTDFDDVSRPVGPAFDIGPYERTNILAPAQMWSPARAENGIAVAGGTAAALAGFAVCELRGHVGKVLLGNGDRYPWYFWLSSRNWKLFCRVADGQGLGTDANSLGYYIDGGLSFNGSRMAYWPSYASGARICHALDVDNQLYWVRVGPTGNWDNSPSANPATDTGGIALPASFWASTDPAAHPQLRLLRVTLTRGLDVLAGSGEMLAEWSPLRRLGLTSGDCVLVRAATRQWDREG